MSVEDHQVSFSLEINVEQAYQDIRRVQTLLYRTLGLLRRMGLSEEIDEAIAQIQRLIAILNSARLAIAALEAASGPIGWALAAVQVGTTLFSVADMIEYEMRGTT